MHYPNRWAVAGAFPLVSLSLVYAPAVFAAILHVPSEYATIGQALTAATAGDIIEVACGTYHEHSLVMKSGVTLRSESGDPACVAVDADSLGRVLLCSGVSSATRIEGITIRGGRTAGYAPTQRGAGMLCDAGAEPTIARCIFEYNTCDYGYGGGLACVESSPFIEESVFRHNAVYGDESDDGLGGAVACQSSEAWFEDCVFEQNDAHNDGGGMYLSESPLEILGCDFLSNTAGRHGGAMRCRAEDPHIMDCAFVGNVTGNAGGAIMIWPDASPTIERCQFRANRALVGGALNIWDSSAPKISNVLFEANRAGNGGGVQIRYGSSPILDWCVFLADSAIAGGGAVESRDGSTPHLRNCTFAFNFAGVGGGALSSWDSHPFLERCIIAFQTQGRVIDCFTSVLDFPELRCCDMFGNAGGDWEVSCVADQAGVNGNFSADPLFCDVEAGNFTLDGASPCLPGQHPEGADCGLIGALDRGCGATASFPATWGSVKSTFADP